ncbi:hypothetical protein EJ04DRAFT_543100 [Polyplosphaeria fusca]|uniref:HECT-type E3 ubiquitin transferase n=1 Tax=Polyplosphaeria fusca TaxID=682080 RepID=A0A9P4V265_9PLEO|nr:hypothetical protein EJ04DRAFT_543100 [Polyplosphaeria fusca]
MKKTSRRSTDPRDRSRSVSDDSGSSSRPADGHPANIVDVEDAGRLMESSQIQRQLRFQHLVRRYLSQISYGCKSAYCTTSTCLSCKKRLNTRPFRAPTQLTARALAHFLASQDDPHQGLCPHELKVPPHTLEVEGVDRIEIPLEYGSHGRFFNVFPSELSPAQKSTLDTRNGADGASGDGARAKPRPGNKRPTSGHRQSGEAKVANSLKGRHQTKKDVKSLSQNLYDTATVIRSFSKQIPSPLSVFSALRIAGEFAASENHGPSVAAYKKEPPPYVSTSETMDHVKSHATRPHVTKTGTPTNSIYSPRSSKAQKPPASLITSEVLSNGEQVHRVRHHLPGSPAQDDDPPTLDGSRDSPTHLKSKMKRKPLSLDVGLAKPGVTILSPLGNRRDEESRAIPPDNNSPALPVTSHLNCKTLESLKDSVYEHRDQQPSGIAYSVDFDTDSFFRPAKPFVNRSLFYTLSDPETLLRSFRDEQNAAYKDSPLPHLDGLRLTSAFRDWTPRNGALVFDSLWIAAKALFNPPPELNVEKSPRLKPSRKSPTSNGPLPQTPSSPEPGYNRYLNDEEAAHIIMICIHALTSSVSIGWPRTWLQLRHLRSWGVLLPDAPTNVDQNDVFDPWLNIIDELEYEPALRLADRLVRGIGARKCFEHILGTLSDRGSTSTLANDFDSDTGRPSFIEILIRHLGVVEQVSLADKRKKKTHHKYSEDPGWTVTSVFMEWLRSLVIKKWDGKADINRWGSVGASVEILVDLYANKELLNLRSDMFHIPYFNERLDTAKEPVEFLSREYQPNTFHIFSYPCLFPPHYLVAYFRTINFTTMYEHYERTERAVHLTRELDPFLKHYHRYTIFKRLETTLSDYLVLDVSRENALEDTFDQLWGQERRSFLKPLKVKMGLQEGEVGLDHGGVTFEFFRIALKDAFDPDKGMFTVDPQTRMTWFQPCALEPEWKYEMVGILFSLAVYNGITLPVTFPQALYRHILGEHPENTLGEICDGWPTLAKSFREFLTWSDGDVADVFLRSYTFSFDVYGKQTDLNMLITEDISNIFPRSAKASRAQFNETKTMPNGSATDGTALDMQGSESIDSPYEECAQDIDSSSEEAPLVTNCSREQYVRDYISWLTRKSVLPQLTAFHKGFSACINPKSLHLFDAPSLKAVVEGTQDIDVAALKFATRYEEGYSASHHTIQDFWSIVELYNPDEKRKLLEFVTASERVPVTGFESMNFYIVRNGDDTEMLPTSSTCFGKLMLPQYASREKMKRKLELAIQNCKGFGVV